ncbi:hypothetical protein Dimus_033718 [Dionaea muscipula]
MAVRYLLCFFLLILHFLTLDAEPISQFALKVNAPDFGSNFALLGDSQIVKEGDFVNLTSDSGVSGAGQIVYKKPIRFIDGKSLKPISFSTDFTFSMMATDEGGGGDGLVLVIFPRGGELSEIFGFGSFGILKNAGKFVAVEYDTRKDENVGDLYGNHVGVDVGSFVSAETADLSSVGLMLNGGERLQSWIDYEASSKRLEIRLNKAGLRRPKIPLISYPIDLAKIWDEREVLVGISSSSGNSTQTVSLYSWSFKERTSPSWLHSQPLDPQVHVNKEQIVHRKKNCALTILGRVIFATGCGTLVAFFLLLLWVVFFLRHSAVPPEFPMKTIDFKYEKIDVKVHKLADGSTR